MSYWLDAETEFISKVPRLNTREAAVGSDTASTATGGPPPATAETATDPIDTAPAPAMARGVSFAVARPDAGAADADARKKPRYFSSALPDVVDPAAPASADRYYLDLYERQAAALSRKEADAVLEEVVEESFATFAAYAERCKQDLVAPRPAAGHSGQATPHATPLTSPKAAGAPTSPKSPTSELSLGRGASIRLTSPPEAAVLLSPVSARPQDLGAPSGGGAPPGALETADPFALNERLQRLLERDDAVALWDDRRPAVRAFQQATTRRLASVAAAHLRVPTLHEAGDFRRRDTNGSTYANRREGLLLHVWRSPAEARRFMAAHGRLHQALSDHGLSLIHAPVTAAATVRGAVATMTQLVPLDATTAPAQHPFLPSPLTEPSLHAQWRVLHCALRHYDDAAEEGQPTAALHRGADGRFYVLSSLQALLPQRLPSSGAVATSLSATVRREALPLLADALRRAHSGGAVSDAAAALAARPWDPMAMEGAVLAECVPRALDNLHAAVGRSGGDHMSLVRGAALSQLLHAAGVNVRYAYVVFRRNSEDRRGEEHFAAAAEVLLAEMAIRTLKELFRADAATNKDDTDDVLCDRMNRLLGHCVVKRSGVWDTHVVPALRAKFTTPADFAVPLSPSLLKVVTARLHKHYGFSFDKEQLRFTKALPVALPLVLFAVPRDVRDSLTGTAEEEALELSRKASLFGASTVGGATAAPRSPPELTPEERVEMEQAAKGRRAAALLDELRGRVGIPMDPDRPESAASSDQWDPSLGLAGPAPAPAAAPPATPPPTVPEMLGSFGALVETLRVARLCLLLGASAQVEQLIEALWQRLPAAAPSAAMRGYVTANLCALEQRRKPPRDPHAAHSDALQDLGDALRTKPHEAWYHALRRAQLLPVATASAINEQRDAVIRTAGLAGAWVRLNDRDWLFDLIAARCRELSPADDPKGLVTDTVAKLAAAGAARPVQRRVEVLRVLRRMTTALVTGNDAARSRDLRDVAERSLRYHIAQFGPVGFQTGVAVAQAVSIAVCALTPSLGAADIAEHKRFQAQAAAFGGMTAPQLQATLESPPFLQSLGLMAQLLARARPDVIAATAVQYTIAAAGEKASQHRAVARALKSLQDRAADRIRRMVRRYRDPAATARARLEVDEAHHRIGMQYVEFLWRHKLEHRVLAWQEARVRAALREVEKAVREKAAEAFWRGRYELRRSERQQEREEEWDSGKKAVARVQREAAKRLALKQEEAAMKAERDAYGRMMRHAELAAGGQISLALAEPEPAPQPATPEDAGPTVAERQALLEQERLHIEEVKRAAAVSAAEADRLRREKAEAEQAAAAEAARRVQVEEDLAKLREVTAQLQRREAEHASVIADRRDLDRREAQARREEEERAAARREERRLELAVKGVSIEAFTQRAQLLQREIIARRTIAEKFGLDLHDTERAVARRVRREEAAARAAQEKKEREERWAQGRDQKEREQEARAALKAASPKRSAGPSTGRKSQQARAPAPQPGDGGTRALDDIPPPSAMLSGAAASPAPRGPGSKASRDPAPEPSPVQAASPSPTKAPKQVQDRGNQGLAAKETLLRSRLLAAERAARTKLRERAEADRAPPPAPGPSELSPEERRRAQEERRAEAQRRMEERRQQQAADAEAVRRSRSEVSKLRSPTKDDHPQDDARVGEEAGEQWDRRAAAEQRMKERKQARDEERRATRLAEEEVSRRRAQESATVAPEPASAPEASGEATTLREERKAAAEQRMKERREAKARREEEARRADSGVRRLKADAVSPIRAAVASKTPTDDGDVALVSPGAALAALRGAAAVTAEQEQRREERRVQAERRMQQRQEAKEAQEQELFEARRRRLEGARLKDHALSPIRAAGEPREEVTPEVAARRAEAERRMSERQAAKQQAAAEARRAQQRAQEWLSGTAPAGRRLTAPTVATAVRARGKHSEEREGELDNLALLERVKLRMDLNVHQIAHIAGAAGAAAPLPTADGRPAWNDDVAVARHHRPARLEPLEGERRERSSVVSGQLSSRHASTPEPPRSTQPLPAA